MTGFPAFPSKFFGENFLREVGILQRRISIQPRFWVFVIVVMLICFGTSYAVTQMRYGQVTQHVNALNQEKVGLMDRISELSSQLSYVRTDDYVERVARDELNMIRPGEIRYVSN